jgi:hypothetical protein
VWQTKAEQRNEAVLEGKSHSECELCADAPKNGPIFVSCKTSELFEKSLLSGSGKHPDFQVTPPKNKYLVPRESVHDLLRNFRFLGIHGRIEFMVETRREDIVRGGTEIL